MINLKVLKAHNNDHGDKRDKVVGDSYSVASAHDADMLIGFGYCAASDEKGTADVGDSDVSGRQGTGTSLKKSG